MEEYKTEKILIIGKANPHGSKKYRETVCTGAITESGELRRLYPVPFRFLNDEQKYTLWSWVEVKWKKSDKDSRPESYKLKSDQDIRIVSSIKGEKNKQKKQILKVVTSSWIEAENLRKKNGNGIVIIPVTKVQLCIAESDSKSEDFQKELFHPDINPIKDVHYTFYLKYYCKNLDACSRLHKQTLLAWEPYAAYAKFRNEMKYEDPLDEVKQKFMERMNEDKFDIFLLLTTHFKRRNIWLVGQWFNFPKQTKKEIEKTTQFSFDL